MSEKSIKVYHYSNKPIQQFENRIGGTWFTDNSYRYPRRRSAEIKHTVEIPKELKLAPAKVANKYLYQGNKELMQVELSKLGYDGVKINVGGDNQYLIFDINKIKPITESIEKVTESTAKQAYKGALKKGEGVAEKTYGVYNIKIGDKPITVIKNPEGGDIEFLNEQYIKKWGNRSNEPKTRTTFDKFGNKYSWMSDSTHADVEPLLEKTINTKLNQNIHLIPNVVESGVENTAKTAYKGLLKKGLKGALITGGGMALGALMSPPVQAAQTILENPEEANPVPEYGTLHSQVEQPYLYTNKVQNQVGLPNGQMPNPANYNIDVRKQAYKNMRSKW